MIIAGNRRYHTAIAAGLTELPCVVRITDSDRAYVLNLIGNLQRKELPVESGPELSRGWQTLQDDAGEPLGVREIARRTHVQRSSDL